MEILPVLDRSGAIDRWRGIDQVQHCGADYTGRSAVATLRRITITSFKALYLSGFLATMITYGALSIYRVDFVDEANVSHMFAAAGIDGAACAYVRMIAANPECRGQGGASQLHEWQMRRHQDTFHHVPIVLDTSTSQGVKAYQRLGFELVGSTAVETGTDSRGTRLHTDAGSLGPDTFVLRAMIRTFH